MAAYPQEARATFLKRKAFTKAFAVWKSTLILAILLIATAACTETPVSTIPPGTANPSASPALPTRLNIDTFLGEIRHDGEEQLALQIADVMDRSVEETYHRRGAAIRDAHPKAHGCVKALFHVDDTIEESLANGVFQPGRTYEAWLRFSNSSADPDQADSTGDGRGMAIKLMGLHVSENPTKGSDTITQDFIMISHPTFFMDDPSDYLSFQEEITSTNWLSKLAIPFTLGLQGTWNAYRITALKIENPLQARYWSMVPYQLGIGPGRQAIKFSALPFVDPSQSCPLVHDELPADPSPNFLRQALRKTLARGQACMQLLLQPRGPGMSVENSKDEWNEAVAPFIKVATIHIPQQEFDTSEQNRFCENLSFDPWHALPEHRPLGVINRIRKVVYARISETRHRLNSASRIEPKGYSARTSVEKISTPPQSHKPD